MSTPDTIDLFAERRNRVRNMLHTWLLATGSLALLAITAWAFGGTAGIVYAVIFGGVSMWAVRRISPQMVLSMYKAREVSAAEFPVGVRIVAELARRAGLPATPRLHIIPSKMINAFAVGRRERSAIAVTDALVRTLTTRELAGVLAHEISHVAHQDVKVMAFADMVARFTSVMSTVGIISLFLNIGSYASGNAGGVPWLAVVVLLAAPTIGGLLQMALSRTREFDADLGAALLTGDPDGLASALTRLERAQGRRWENILLPSGRIPDPSVLRSHPLTADRIARLNALKSTVGGGEDETFSRPEIGRPLPRRPSLVPRVRPMPHYGLFGVQAPSGEGEPLDLTGEGPASERPLNPAEGEPRIHFRRGAVWW
jgi:heat shock protein HtpX